jgi:gamma-glutamyltranspeptidase/glutathione hydrolase
MTPTIVLQGGKPWALVGSIGGRSIINTVLQVLLNLIDCQMNIAEAVEAGRVDHQWFPDHIQIERNLLSDDLRKALELKGHRVQRTSKLGRMNCIVIDPRTGLRQGAADSRDPDAKAVGY